MLKKQAITIEEIYVPTKRRQTLDPKKVEALAESILSKGQEAPILVRADGKRFVLIEGLHAWKLARRSVRRLCRPILSNLDNIELIHQHLVREYPRILMESEHE